MPKKRHPTAWTCPFADVDSLLASIRRRRSSSALCGRLEVAKKRSMPLITTSHRSAAVQFWSFQIVQRERLFARFPRRGSTISARRSGTDSRSNEKLALISSDRRPGWPSCQRSRIWRASWPLPIHRQFARLDRFELCHAGTLAPTTSRPIPGRRRCEASARRRHRVDRMRPGSGPAPTDRSIRLAGR